jgi:hypothetical protein
MADTQFKDDIRVELLDRLSKGESMRAICSDHRMPSRETVRLWCESDPDLALAITRAREVGFETRAEKAVEDAKAALDPQRGRLAFDAERWYLGKLSKAFADKVTVAGDTENPVQHRHEIDLHALDQLTQEERDAVRAILSRRAQ